MKTTFVCVLTGALLCACGGGSDQPPASSARYTCAEVANVDKAKFCDTDKAALFSIKSAQAIDVITGQVRRAQLVAVTQQMENATPARFTGWVRAEFDAGCNGAPTWEILPLQPIIVEAGDSLNMSVSGECGDMPKGQRTLTATLYQSDGRTPVDRATVFFELVD